MGTWLRLSPAIRKAMDENLCNKNYFYYIMIKVKVKELIKGAKSYNIQYFYGV